MKVESLGVQGNLEVATWEAHMRCVAENLNIVVG
jgi:hypothetical protein